MDPDKELIMKATAQVAASYASSNPSADVSSTVKVLFKTFQSLLRAPADPPKPVVPFDKIQGPDGVLCLECNRRFRMLRRHLSAEHDMSPHDYLQKYNLSPDALIDAAYSEERSTIAKQLGLGHRDKIPTTPKSTSARKQAGKR